MISALDDLSILVGCRQQSQTGTQRYTSASLWCHGLILHTKQGDMLHKALLLGFAAVSEFRNKILQALRQAKISPRIEDHTFAHVTTSM